MDPDDDDGVGYISQSHFLKSSERQAVPLLKMSPQSRELSSNVADMDVPIYSRDNLTRAPTSVKGAKELEKKTRNDSNSSTLVTSKDESGFNGRLAFAIAAAAFGSSFQHGYNTGVLNNPETIMKNWINESIHNRTDEYPTQTSVAVMWSVTVSIFCFGGMIGGALTGTIAEAFGRKGGLLLNNILVIIAVILQCSAKAVGYYELIAAGRFLIGINSGLNAGLAPMYLSEISPINLRGAVGTVYQLVITISIFIAQVLGLPYILGEYWPTLLGMTAVPAIFQLVTLPFCPESPKYLLVTRGKELEAQRALTWLRGSVEVHEEMYEMSSECESQKLLPTVTLREIISNNALRIPLIIALTMMLAQQLSGINAVMFFSTSIFLKAGLEDVKATYATLGMGAINVFMTLVSLVLVERAGRKTLLLVGFAGMTVDIVFLTLAMLYSEYSSFAKYMCVVLIYIYIVMFASGPGSIPWFLVSELFNQSARPIATSLAVTVNWGANFIVGLGFPLLSEAMGAYVFILFVVFLSLSVVFIYYKVPETKNKTMEEISSMFRQQSYQ